MRDHAKGRPADNRTAPNRIADGDSPSLPAVHRLNLADAQAPRIDVDHFGARVLQDALAEATAAYWRNRAEDFERARSRPGDYPGEASPDQIAEADARLSAQADACRARAAAALPDSDVLDLVVQAVLDDEEAAS